MTAKSAAIPWPERLRVAALGLVLIWINLYISRELFHSPTAAMNSMHGFWIALARHAGNSWFQSNWWPYWDGGMPFEFTYAPLVPGLTAAIMFLARLPDILALQAVTAVVYCLGPLTLFVMAWLLMRAPGYAFASALIYSLTSPTQLIVPDAEFALRSFWDARRFYLVTIWDDTPHAAALALLPIAILFLILSLKRCRVRYYIPTIFLIALMALASEFGIVEIIMVVVCLLFVLPRADFRKNLAITLGLGAAAYAVVVPFFPPSLLGAIGKASTTDGESIFTIGSLTAMAIVAVGWALLARYLPSWTQDWKLQFFIYFSYLTSSVPILFQYLHRQFLPQPSRYKLEMELALALVIAFASRPWFERIPRPLRVAVTFLLLSLAGEQLVSHRRFAKAVLTPGDLTQTIEYRTALEAQAIGTRTMLPGSIAQWANAFSDVKQFSGSSWSKAMNPVQQLGMAAVYNGGATPEEDLRISLAWLRAFGVGAIAINGPQSEEFWKPYAHPLKFVGLPILWRAKDLAIYDVPHRTDSLAHVVPREAILRHAPRNIADIGEMEAYVLAVDDPRLSPAKMQWSGSNHFQFATLAAPGQVISIQVSYHPGWHASSEGHAIPLHGDGLGLMWLDPQCHGRCEVNLDYDGGWELRLSRYVSWAAIAALLLVPLARFLRRRDRFTAVTAE